MQRVDEKKEVFSYKAKPSIVQKAKKKLNKQNKKLKPSEQHTISSKIEQLLSNYAADEYYRNMAEVEQIGYPHK